MQKKASAATAKPAGVAVAAAARPEAALATAVATPVKASAVNQASRPRIATRCAPNNHG